MATTTRQNALIVTAFFNQPSLKTYGDQPHTMRGTDRFVHNHPLTGGYFFVKKLKNLQKIGQICLTWGGGGKMNI